MNSEYFPPFEIIKAGLAFSSDGEVVSMSRDLFAMLLRAATAASFDPVWYKSAHPDITAAIEEGSIEDELEHYSTFGYEEGRHPVYFVVDNDWYLTNYPDIHDAIGPHGYLDAEAHFNEVGYSEGRAADAAMMAQIEAWDHAISASQLKVGGAAPDDTAATDEEGGAGA
jgi:hypothetical protein